MITLHRPHIAVAGPGEYSTSCPEASGITAPPLTTTWRTFDDFTPLPDPSTIGDHEDFRQASTMNRDERRGGHGIDREAQSAYHTQGEVVLNTVFADKSILPSSLTRFDISN
jgi:hypothetical protein